MQGLLVTGIFIYPVKSLGGIELQSSEVKMKGLAFDRRWMLVDEHNRFLTQRFLPQMSLFRISFAPGKSKFLISYGEQVSELFFALNGDSFFADIWGDSVEVVEPDVNLSKWFSACLGITCRLVGFPEENMRPVDPDYAVDMHDQTSLSDGYPILMIGQSSLYDLNSRLDERVGMERFRPNIIFTGGEPFLEDRLNRFSINNVSMAGVKPCARCVMTTIDQRTGIAGKEPLATLSGYRKVGNKVLFGQNVIPLQEGIISVGDEISF